MNCSAIEGREMRTTKEHTCVQARIFLCRYFIITKWSVRIYSRFYYSPLNIYLVGYMRLREVRRKGLDAKEEGLPVVVVSQFAIKGGVLFYAIDNRFFDDANDRV